MSIMVLRNLFIIGLMTATLTASANGTKAIDAHCHNVMPEFVHFLENKGVALEETFPLPVWDVNSHLAFMDSAGIQTSVLSMPAPQPYYGDKEETKRVIRQYNEAAAALKRVYPDRFMFVAALPLPDVDAAIDEAAYALDSLGADGIKLATNSRGQSVGDAGLDPLMEALSSRNAVVILHPHKPVPVNDSLIAVTPLAIYEYMAETTRTVANMLSRNVPARFSGIRWVVPHCGSFLPLSIPRMKAVLPAMTAKGIMQPIDWKANLKNLYYDLAGSASPDVVKSLLTITTPDHLLYGSDYPYQPAAVLEKTLTGMRSWLAADPTLAPYTADILRNNALRLFGRPAPMEQQTAAQQVAKLPMQPDGIVRLSRVEVFPEYLDEYIKMATEVGQTSLLTEPGVLTMYAMAEKDNPTVITILETYASAEAYKAHIASAHFRKYKQGTLHMVKDLRLLDQKELNPANRIINFIAPI